ncbi:MAG TPA: hypothetical protein VF828_03780 [Patescibacteria group bacterium]
MLNSFTNSKNIAVGSILAIIVLTILEFPAPIGFETRPQTNVSVGWLFFFLTIVVTEIAAVPLLIKKPHLGQKLGIAAGILNILQVAADQFHLMQPEVAPLNYTLLEYSVVIFSLILIYFSLTSKKFSPTSH